MICYHAKTNKNDAPAGLYDNNNINNKEVEH